MDIAIRGRNVEVSDVLRTSVEQKVSRLTRFVDGMERAEVLFSEERNPRIADKSACEVTVHGRGHVVRARATAADTFAAVDRVVDKLEHQMIKLKGKLVGRSQPRRQAPPPLDNYLGEGGDAAEEGEADEDGGGTEARIVKTKRFSIKPMTPEEAALQLDLLGHGFYFFTNSETERAAVVYRRHDGHIGLIDAT
jgi:putative sigma-54 modulation protein